ncbi:MAG: FAD-dependent oxidoreductase, partial [Haloarculaceae archaeon]
MSTHVAVIGAYGSAGAAVADSLADRPDVDLTLIDDGDPGGGLCILRGCMPSKEVISAAEHRFAGRHDDRLDGPYPDVDLERVVEQKDDRTLGWAGHRRESVERIGAQDGNEFIHDAARFVDDRRIAVGDRTLEPDYVVIATGSSVSLPPVPGIESAPVQTSADVLDATDFGDSGIVMGLGYIGLELAPYLTEAAGMDVTSIDVLPELLPEADPGFGEEMADYYREEFDMEVLLDTAAQRVEETADGGVRVTVDADGEERVLEADQLFVFTGRAPNLDGLGLDDTSIAPEDDWVRDTMQARDDDRVFVVGD